MIGKIPKRYASNTFENSNFNYKEMEIIEKTISLKNSLLLIGKTGSGKTHLASVIYNGTDIDKAWLDVNEYIFEMKRRMALKTTDASSVLNAGWNLAIYSSLIVLDDLGAEEEDSTTKSILTRILMDRYNNQRWTIITTNLDGKELKNKYGERIISRIYEDFTVVLLNTKDRRKEKFAKVVEI